MPVSYYQLDPGNAAQPGYNVAKELARQVVAQFGSVRGAGAGIAGGSCCAALAVVPDQAAGFGAAMSVSVGLINPAQLPYGIVFGNSRLAGGGLDLGPLAGHAERAALTATRAQGRNLNLFTLNNDAVLFVELTPCEPCSRWLEGVVGSGVPNPFNGIINGVGALTTLNVWWRWTYPGNGVADMKASHAEQLQTQLTNSNNL